VSIFIFFTNFFLKTVSNRFCALLSIRAALLIGSRCVVVFAIFFLSFISRCRKPDTLSPAVGDAFKVPVYRVSGRSIPNTSYRGNDRRATGFVRAFTELASAPCSSFLYSMTGWSRAASIERRKHGQIVNGVNLSLRWWNPDLSHYGH